MNVLAIDTATEQCSVAVRLEGRTFEERVVTARGHAELLLPMVERVLADAGCKLADMEGLAFGRGPGAFTGVRIAVGVIQGLSLGSGLPVVGISTLAAVAHPCAARGAHVLVCMDARMNEVYWARYRLDANGLLALDGDERVGSPESVSAGEATHGVGTGFRAYPVLKQRFPALQLDDAALPTAASIALLGEQRLLKGEGKPAADAQPVYLRDQVAWTAVVAK